MAIIIKKEKDNKRWGKGGAVISLLLILALAFQPVAFAGGRSSAGGGDLEHFDTGRVATNIGIGIASAAIGGAISSGIKAGSLSAAGSSLAGSANYGAMATNYNTFVATTQVSRAVGQAGAYHDWNPSTTFVVTSVANGATAGFLNPDVAVGNSASNSTLGSTTSSSISNSSLSNMGKGAMIGGLAGGARGGTIIAIDGNKINKNEDIGAVSQIAGMAAGIAATNFGRELVNPTAYGQVYQKEKVDLPKESDIEICKVDKIDAGNVGTEEPSFKDVQNFSQEWLKSPETDTRVDTIYASKDTLAEKDWCSKFDVPAEGLKSSGVVAGTGTDLQVGSSSGQEYKYYRVDKMDMNGVAQRTELTGAELVDVQNKFASGNYEARPMGQDTVYLAPTTAHISAQGLVDATFVKTGDMWPQIVTRGLSIAASTELGEKNKVTPLVSYSIEGVAGPVLSSAAETYGLKPSLYTGGNVTANRVAYVDNVKQAAYTHKMNDIGTTLHKAHAAGAGNAATYQAVLKDKGVNVDNVTVPDINSFDQMVGIRKADLDKKLSDGDISPADYKTSLAELSKTKSDNFNASGAMMGVASSRAGVDIQAQMKAAPTLDAALEVAGTSKAGLAWNGALKDAKFGLVEAAVSGGASALTSKIVDKNPTYGAAMNYGVAMLTGAARGVMYNKNWEEGHQQGDLAWSDRYSIYAPQRSEGDDWWSNKVDEYTYPREAAKYNEFGKVSHIRSTADNYEISFEDKQPGLGKAVLVSMGQTNREFLNRSFGFGAPQTSAKNVTSPMFVDYLSNLGSYAVTASRPGGINTVLSQSYTSAASQATSNNVMTSMSTSRPVADALNIQQERLTPTSSPSSPYTVQMRDYRPWALNVETSFYLPFPSDSYKAKSTTGKSFTRDK